MLGGWLLGWIGALGLGFVELGLVGAWRGVAGPSSGQRLMVGGKSRGWGLQARRRSACVIANTELFSTFSLSLSPLAAFDVPESQTSNKIEKKRVYFD